MQSWLASSTCALLALVQASDTVQISGVLRVGDAGGPPAKNVRVIVGEIGHATLHYNTPEAMFVSTVGLPDELGKRFAAEGRTDVSGRFQFDGLAAGEYTLLAAHEALGLYRATFRVEAGSGARDVLGVLEPSARIECVVLGLAHDPQRHVLELQAEGAQANIRWAPRLEQSKASWSFRSAPLPGGVLWRVWGSEVVFAQGYRATLFSELVRTQSGADEKLSLALSDGETIAGTVTGAQGEPASGVSVIVRKGTSERGAITDARGRYSVCGLPSGPCAVEVSRWTLRQLAGCGNGARDLYAQRELVLPLGVPSTGDFQLPESIVAPSAGELAPEFEVPTLSGGLLSLASLRGKVVLLEFWATWCGMCRAELPHLAEMYGELAAGGRFEIVGVSIDVDVELVPRYLASRKIRWPQLEPAPADENPVARAYNVNSTPANVLIGPDGKIVALNVTGAELRKRIDSLLR